MIRMLLTGCFFLFLATMTSAQLDGRYCNSRYDYCLDYPAIEFSELEESDNFDGAMVTQVEKGIYAQVSATNNILNWRMEEIRKIEEEEMEELYGELTFEGEKPTKDYLEMSFETEGMPHVLKVYRRGDVLVFLRLWVEKPIAPKRFEEILVQLEVDLKL